MDYKKELQNEYAIWNNKKVKRAHRVIQVKNYTKEQIYHQIKEITEVATKDVERYLVEYMNKEDSLTEEEDSISEDSENTLNGEIEEESIEESSEKDQNYISCKEDSDFVDEDEHISTVSEPNCNETKNKLETEQKNETETEVDDFSDVSSGDDYNSEELDDIYNYLEEGDGESTDLLTETAEETLKKLSK